MKFKKTGKNAVEIILSQGELSALELCPPQMDCTDPLTHKILCRLLQRAAKETGLCLTGSDFLIEVSDAQEGAVFTLTRVDGEETQTQQLVQVYCFDSSEEMIQSGIHLHRGFGSRLGKNSLYKWEKKYYLSLSPLKEDCALVKGMLLEYGGKAQHDALADGILKEHAECLIQDTAAQTLEQYFKY